jgi:predicted DNA-binding protein (MmcQ/YjbR family)
MDIDWIRKFCLALPGATEQVQWEDDLLFKVGGRMFAVVPLEPAPVWMSFKCSEKDFAELIEMPGIIPAPYLARAKWVALETESALPHPEIQRLLSQSHTLVLAKLTKKVQAEIAQGLSNAKKKKRKRR